MTKTFTHFVCQQCGRASPKLLGRCPGCGTWNSMLEEFVPNAGGSAIRLKTGGTSSLSSPRKMQDIEGDVDERLVLPIAEFARVLGGGIVPGSVVLIGGDPGIGKSTLVLQMAMQLGMSIPVLYVSGEESERQIKMRASRLLDGTAALPDELLLVTETNLDVILSHLSQTQPALIIVDSIQTTFLPEMDSSAGSLSQVRECASRLREYAKASSVSVFLIGHVTKEGVIAGPRVLEHIVDTVLYLEGDAFQTYRLLRSVKNRFGTTAEVGVFTMSERGLTEVSNPSEAFLAERLVNSPGSAISVTMEGTRPLLVEIQGLTSHTNFGNARRTPNGVDLNRLLMVVAVLARRLNLPLNEQDVFVNVVGGLKIMEPALDLAIATAVASSYRDVPVRADTVLLGEIGLSGELRMVSQIEPRIKEAANLGFKRIVIPKRLNNKDKRPTDIEVVEVRTIREALETALTKAMKTNKGIN
ncbi:MAG: DNA repair protein RadA [Anaerolineaceae bacterium]|nr:DNA repair protein RadA [Anaerolineaceae bacterium]